MYNIVIIVQATAYRTVTLHRIEKTFICDALYQETHVEYREAQYM